jgi:ribosome-binding protein aMBF1 (putative translation factor)
MPAQQSNATHRSSATDATRPTSEEDWFRRYNDRPIDTAAARTARNQPAWSVDPLRIKLRELRQARGWSLDRAAAVAGMPAVVIGSYERGDRTPTAGRLRQLLAAYGYELAIIPAGTAVHAAVVDELRAIADRIESEQVAA